MLEACAKQISERAEGAATGGEARWWRAGRATEARLQHERAVAGQRVQAAALPQVPHARAVVLAAGREQAAAGREV